MRIRKSLKLPALLLAFGLVATACGGDDDDDTTTGGTDTESPTAVNGTDGTQASGQDGAGTSTLDVVRDRGSLRCGVNGQLAGFSLQEGGTYTGFDADYCKGVAAAILGDPEAVEFVDLTADTRFTALQSGEVDVLIRNTTWTVSRDSSLGLAFTATTFYDGQGMLVNADSEFQTLDDLQNTVICVQSGTTTELNLATVFAARQIEYEPLLLPDEEQITQQFEAGACDGYTTDKSGLASFKQTFAGGPDSVRILDETMSKEPLGPATRQGDDAFFDIVQWVVFATFQAEEFGLTSENIGTYDGDDPEILRFIGQGAGEDAQFESGLGIDEGWTVDVIEAIGNYQEIYDRNIVPLGLPEGQNQLYTEGGLHYPPPYR
ncbi:MAG: amino acid ABC transporter substrate-binding protein [Actinobacteria bacterium]|nr:amino acid ABC transporter substrate-binding protein [Actinomycetota bacterium]